jgi:hypothetical protein
MNDATTALLRALCGKFDKFAVEEVTSRDWASGTFAGTRHKLTFRSEGENSEAAAEAFLATLTEAEFDLRGHILADIALVSQMRTSGPDGPLVRISLEALTVEDA